MPSAVIFDLSEVLLTGMLGIEQTLSRELSREPAAVTEQLKIPELIQLFHGQLAEESYWQRVIEQHNWPVNVSYCKHVIRANFREIDGVRSIIQRLRSQGYRLGLLSIHAREWIEFCSERFDHHALFDCWVYSYEVGVSKPDPAAYQHILKRLSVSAETAVFIDDYLPNVEAARALGIHGIQFQHSTQLLSDLRRIGVVIT